MRNSELIRRKLVAVALMLGLVVRSSSTQAAVAMPLVKPPSKGGSPTARPPHMPCQIMLWKKQNGEDALGTWSLYYDKNGRLALATQWISTTECPNPSPTECYGREVVATRYAYDAQGHLADVTMPNQYGAAHMTMTYLSGKPAQYSWVVPGADGRANQVETQIYYDAVGHPAAFAKKAKIFDRKAKGWWKSQELTRMDGAQGPFAVEPVVWPDDIETLYLGWTSTFSLTKFDANALGTVNAVEVVTVDGKGRLKNAEETTKGRSKNWIRRFVYECENERPAEEVTFEVGQ